MFPLECYDRKELPLILGDWREVTGVRDSPWVFPGNQETLPAKGCRGDGSGPVLGASRSLGGATGLAEAPPPTPQATASGVRPEGVRTPQRERRAPARMRLPDAVCSENEPRRLAAQASRSHSPCAGSLGSRLPRVRLFPPVPGFGASSPFLPAPHPFAPWLWL